jgi:UPF0755 protein
MARKKKTRFLYTLIILSLLGIASFFIYRKFFAGVRLKDKKYTYIYIGRGDTFEDVLDDVNSEGILKDPESFEWLAAKMQLPANIHPGRYRIINGMTMRQVINLIKYNKEEKVKLSYNSQIHTLDEFVAYTDEKLELDSDQISEMIDDENVLSEKFGLDPLNAFALVVPGSYEVSWAISDTALFDLLSKRFKSLWNASRRAKADRLGLRVPEVITLASIVQSESSIESEQRKIAGVYINRLKKDMPLQADPTLKFAAGDFSLQRILDKDMQVNSPYNTYRYKGLPPGPICLVTQQAIDATLNYQKHNYIYFCAKPELNGYSEYSATYEEHRRHANAYRKALDRLGISR